MHRGLLFNGVVRDVRALPTQPGETRAPLHSVAVEISEETEAINLLCSDSETVADVMKVKGQETLLRVSARKAQSGNVNLWITAVLDAPGESASANNSRGGRAAVEAVA